VQATVHRQPIDSSNPLVRQDHLYDRSALALPPPYSCVSTAKLVGPSRRHNSKAIVSYRQLSSAIVSYRQLSSRARPISPASGGQVAHAAYTDPGVTTQRHILAIAPDLTSKGANRWEEQFYLGKDPEAQIVYGTSPEDVS